MPHTAKKHTFLRLHDSAHLPASLRGAVIAIGNFDGVHRGHQAVLAAALARARATGKKALVFTFEPHPRSLFQTGAPLYRLTTAAQKAAIFAEMGFDAVIEQSFTREFAALSAQDFVSRIIAGSCAASCLVAGANFHFGHKRSGTPEFLCRAGRDYGFAVQLAEGKQDETGKLISSSRIRALLEAGHNAEANRLLGRPYALEAEIIRGQRLGRQLGFPTANMAPPPEIKLKFGIYAVYFRLQNRLFQGVASYGRRPTIEAEGAPLLETHIFNFSDMIYGKRAAALLIGFLRPEEKFADTASLIAQMHKDAAAAKKLLAANPLS